MINEPSPTFDEALVRFRDCVAGQGIAPDFVWIFREDVVERWPTTYIKVPIENDLPLVEAIYNEAVERGLGVHLVSYCVLDGRPCCYIHFPKDEQDALDRWLARFKLSVRQDPPNRRIVPVGSRLRWAWLKCRERPGPMDDLLAELPQRT